MGYISLRNIWIGLCALVLLATAGGPCGNVGGDPSVSPVGTTLAQFVDAVREKAKAAENTSGMRAGFASFSAAHSLSSSSIRYSDFVVVQLLFEATRDAGFWNLHWTRYAGASDVTLQKQRYLREGVFLGAWSPHEAARVALQWQGHPGYTSVEDVAALQNFAEDMGSGH